VQSQPITAGQADTADATGVVTFNDASGTTV
jgi:hypothetical protein